MDEWFGLFAACVWRYLDGVLAREVDGAAGSDARLLAGAWRALLRRHERRQDGSCATCGRVRDGACGVWQVAIGYFVRAPRR